MADRMIVEEPGDLLELDEVPCCAGLVSGDSPSPRS